MDTSLFVPCFVDQLFPEAGLAALRVLDRLGFAPRVSTAHCCGQALSNAGDGPGAASLLDAWKKGHPNGETIILLSASCTEHIRHETETSAQAPQVFEFCEFLERHGPAGFEKPVQKTLLLHQSCSAQRGTQSARAMSAILRRVKGLQLLEPTSPDGECCGFGGSFSTSFPELSCSMGRDRLAHLQTALPPKGDTHAWPETPVLPGSPGGSPAGADALVSADLSCLMHLCSLHGYPGWPLLHPAQILLEAL